MNNVRHTPRDLETQAARRRASTSSYSIVSGLLQATSRKRTTSLDRDESQTIMISSYDLRFPAMLTLDVSAQACPGRFNPR
jgi:hypothetical protein